MLSHFYQHPSSLTDLRQKVLLTEMTTIKICGASDLVHIILAILSQKPICPSIKAGIQK